MNIFRRLITIFFTIYSCIIIIMTFGRYALSIHEPLELSYLSAIFFFSILGTLPSLIIMPRKAISDQQMKLRYILHFVLLMSVILYFAHILGFVQSPDDFIFLMIEVALIYLIVRFLTWRTDKKTSDEINERLRHRNAGK